MSRHLVVNLLRAPHKLLALILWLVALHSFLVGCGLVLQPPGLMAFAGFSLDYDRFFPAQGGVFHIVMAICYAMSAIDVGKSGRLIVFSIILKTTATAFLLIYYFVIDSKLIILLSGIGDGLMGLAILLSFCYYLSSSEFGKTR
ncbi:MAG: hypothetical protein SV775_19310 [Thermodesulfobacteriota bacterium]|nr:hypothetical protein [Thermodesulfobacteriota bacterium]